MFPLSFPAIIEIAAQLITELRRKRRPLKKGSKSIKARIIGDDGIPKGSSTIFIKATHKTAAAPSADKPAAIEPTKIIIISENPMGIPYNCIVKIDAAANNAISA